MYIYIYVQFVWPVKCWCCMKTRALIEALGLGTLSKQYAIGNYLPSLPHAQPHTFPQAQQIPSATRSYKHSYTLTPHQLCILHSHTPYSPSILQPNTHLPNSPRTDYISSLNFIHLRIPHLCVCTRTPTQIQLLHQIHIFSLTHISPTASYFPSQYPATCFPK